MENIPHLFKLLTKLLIYPIYFNFGRKKSYFTGLLLADSENANYFFLNNTLGKKREKTIFLEFNCIHWLNR